MTQFNWQRTIYGRQLVQLGALELPRSWCLYTYMYSAGEA